MMEGKENFNSSELTSSDRAKEVASSGAPSLKERMKRLAQQQRAWENEEDVPSPVIGTLRRERAPRPSLNPDSGQVTHMKARFMRLAEEIRERDDDFKVSTKQWSLSVQPPSPVRRRWQPPEPLSESQPSPVMPPGAANLRSRSPSPSRAEMPNSPRGGAFGEVERPLPKPVSARKATWENQIATSMAEAAKGKPPIGPRSPSSFEWKTVTRTPPMPSGVARKDCERLSPELQKSMPSTSPKPPSTSSSELGNNSEGSVAVEVSERLPPQVKPSMSSDRSSSGQNVRSDTVTPSTSGESLRSSERSARKESLRKQRERQQQLKYEAGLVAIGFDVEPQQSTTAPSLEGNLKRTNEVAFKRPATSSLLSIISSTSSDRSVEDRTSLGLDAGKRAKMLNFISDAQLPFSSAVDRGEDSHDEEDDDLEMVSEVEIGDSETNSLFCDDRMTLEKVVPYMDSMHRAERRASLVDETITVVTTESDIDEEGTSGPNSMETSADEPTLPKEHDPETKSKMLAFMETRQISHRDIVSSVAADDSKPSSGGKSDVTRLLDEAMASLNSSVDELQDNEITNVTDISASTPLCDTSPRRLRRGRRSSSWSDLRSPCLSKLALNVSAEPTLPQDLAYSVKKYRDIVDQRKRSPPCARIYSLDLDSCGTKSPDASSRWAKPAPGLGPWTADSKRVLSLQQLAQQQEAVIMQASKALHEVLANGLSGSAQHVECSRVLVVACQKRQAFLEECSRLLGGRSAANLGTGASSVLTVSGVQLALKAGYLQRLKVQQQLLQHGNDTAIEQHHFLCMLRLRDGRVHATELTSTGTNFGPSSRDFVEIPTCLTVKDLPQGFMVNLDVYGFSLTRASEAAAEATSASSTRTPSREHSATPRRFLERLRSSRTPSGPKTTPSSTGTAPGWTPHGGFTHLSTVRLTAESVSQSVFPLMKLPALSPLEGILKVRLRLTSEPRIEHRGFLNVFAEVGGFGSWFRRWCSLRQDQLLMWTYPEEETRGNPALACLSLRQCLTRRVEPMSREKCARPNTMQLLLLRAARSGEADNLVLRRHHDMVLEKCMLSAESRKELQEWSDRLSECLFMLRQWHADHYRQLEIQAQPLALP